MSSRLIIGDVRAKLAELPDESVHCVVTSPPYFGLRDYGVAGQIGLEPTPAEFVAVMVEVFREVRRVLRRDGTLWLNLGDSYSGNGLSGGDGSRAFGGTRPDKIARQALIQSTAAPKRDSGLKPKDLLGIPWRVAFALQADGWYLRQDIIWAKPNPMPESVTDRCTKAHEYLFLLTRSPRYHYDAEAIAEKAETAEHHHRYAEAAKGYTAKAKNTPGQSPQSNGAMMGVPDNGTRNRRSVWTVATQPFKEAHFATFPPDLIEPCIKAGCPKDCCAKCGAPVVREVERTFTPTQNPDFPKGGKKGLDESNGWGDTPRGTTSATTTGWSPSCSCDAGLARGTVLDPFGGAGTTGLVADRLQRDAILIELNPAYAALADLRITDDGPLFAEVTA